MRFFLKPGSFITQLQWSPHHSLILAAFFASAVMETQLGGQQYLYGRLASLLAHDLGLSLGAAIWLVTFLKLVSLQVGAWLLTEAVYFLGTLFGKPASRRVLFRRLAVVFSMLLLAQSAYGLAATYPLAWVVCGLLWLWGLLFGYYTVREQFGLTFGEASAIGVFVLFLAVGGWIFTVSSLEEQVARAKPTAPAPQLAKRPLPHPHHHFR